MITINLTVNSVDVATSVANNVVTASASGATYQWINCTLNTELVGETNQSYTITDNDDYAVIVTQGNCTDTSLCVSAVVTGIEEESFGAAISLYPNPTNNNVIIDLGTLTGVDVFVMDITGKTVLSNQNETSNQVNLNTSSLKNGLYFVYIQSDDQKRVLKLIKQ